MKNKTPQESSNIFHSIMKASVSKTATKKNDFDFKGFQSEVKDKFGIEIIWNDRIVFPEGTNENVVIEIQNFYKSLKS